MELTATLSCPSTARILTVWKAVWRKRSFIKISDILGKLTSESIPKAVRVKNYQKKKRQNSKKHGKAMRNLMLLYTEHLLTKSVFPGISLLFSLLFRNSQCVLTKTDGEDDCCSTGLIQYNSHRCWLLRKRLSLLFNTTEIWIMRKTSSI